MNEVIFSPWVMHLCHLIIVCKKWVIKGGNINVWLTFLCRYLFWRIYWPWKGVNFYVMYHIMIYSWFTVKFKRDTAYYDITVRCQYVILCSCDKMYIRTKTWFDYKSWPLHTQILVCTLNLIIHFLVYRFVEQTISAFSVEQYNVFECKDLNVMISHVTNEGIPKQINFNVPCSFDNPFFQYELWWFLEDLMTDEQTSQNNNILSMVSKKSLTYIMKMISQTPTLNHHSNLFSLNTTKTRFFEWV